jgi:4-hydroxy-3-methylbut-2-enyl diphosphate reductase
LRVDDFADAETVLITAGASAPESVVEATVDWLVQHFDATVESEQIREESVRFPLPKPLRELAAETKS